MLFGVIGCFRETEPIDKFLEIYKQERNVRKRERTRGRDFRKLANRIAGPADQKSVKQYHRLEILAKADVVIFLSPNPTE